LQQLAARGPHFLAIAVFELDRVGPELQQQDRLAVGQAMKVGIVSRILPPCN